MTDDPLHALARANPFPNDAPVDLPDLVVTTTPSTRRSWVDRCVVAASLALGASLGWGLISSIVDPADTRSNRCVVISSEVVDANGVCLTSASP